MAKSDKALEWLFDHPGATPSDLAEDLGIQSIYAGQILAKLFDQGLVDRERGGGVGRAYHYTALSNGDRREPVAKVPKEELPTTISFKVVAELKNGNMLLQHKGEFFVARLVDLADIVRL